MPTITAKPVLTIDGTTATMTFSKIDGDGCELSVAYVCDQFRGRFCNEFVLPTEYESAGLCWRQFIYSFPQIDLPVSNDGFAIASDPFDASQEYWEFADDDEIVTFVALEIDLSETPIPKDAQPIAALLKLHCDSGELSAKFRAKVVDELPGAAPETPDAAGALLASIDGEFTINLTGAFKAKLESLGDGDELEVLYVLIQINPTGTSGIKRIASSRHTDSGLRPVFSLRF